MPAADSLTNFEDIAKSSPRIQLAVMASGAQGALIFQRLNIHEDLGADLTRIPERLARRVEDASLHEYEPGFRPEKHELAYLPVEQHPSVQQIIDSLAAVGDLQLFEARDEVIEHLRSYVLTLQGEDDRTAYLFRSTSPKFELGRKVRFAMIFADGTYNKLDEKVFMLDEEVDCFYCDGYLYIQSVYQFQRIFSFFEQLRDRAAQTLNTVLQNVPVKNADDFRQATGQLQMMSKLASIASRPYITTLSFETTKDIINEFGLDIPVEIDDDGQEKLVFEQNADKRWNILKLLDDDYLTSRMTTLKYEVNSKRTHS